MFTRGEKTFPGFGEKIFLIETFLNYLGQEGETKKDRRRFLLLVTSEPFFFRGKLIKTDKRTKRQKEIIKRILLERNHFLRQFNFLKIQLYCLEKKAQVSGRKTI